MKDNEALAAEAKGVISDESDSEKKNRSSVPETVAKFAVVPSPAPVAVPGGDDDFFTLSAVRKIKVTAPPIPADSKPAAAITTRISGNFLENNNATSGQNDDEPSESSEDDYDSDAERMDLIEKSPYEVNQDAEKGEPIFSRIKEILKEEKNDGRGKVSDEAKQIFGASLAREMVKASSLIQMSGMVYSQEWTEGMIRGERIGAPKELILLCLVSNRLSKQGDQLLSGLTRDFGVSSMIAEGLKQFKFDKKYPRIMSVTKNYQFSKRRRDCYKAAIFVARTFVCKKALGNEGALGLNLKNKILVCLDMMEANLRDDDSKKKRTSTDSVPKSLPELVDLLPLDTLEPPKRKRGRPRKHPLPVTAPTKHDAANDDMESETEFDDIVDSPVATVKKKKRKSATEASKKGALTELSFDEGDDNDTLYAYNPPSRDKTGKKKSESAACDEGTRGKKAVTSSLPNLISLFEQQYHEMGKVYRKMGETLQELKSKIQENRTATEEELRAEILLEVQESLLKNFGKPSSKM